MAVSFMCNMQEKVAAALQAESAVNHISLVFVRSTVSKISTVESSLSILYLATT